MGDGGAMNTLNELMHAVGLVGYAVIVALAVIWAGIGISYLRSGRSPLTWLPFVISMVSFAVLFFGLTLVATNSTLFDGQPRAILIRGVSALAGFGGLAYTVNMLREEWALAKRMNEHR